MSKQRNNDKWWDGWFWGFIQGIAATLALAATTLAVMEMIK